MIAEAARYYGAVLSYIVGHSEVPITIQAPKGGIAGEYVIDGKLALLIKYSTKRRGPWAFNLHGSHLARIRRMADAMQDVVIVFVCGSDGIVAIKVEDLAKIVADRPGQQAVAIRRKLNHMYGLKGPLGQLDRRLSRGSLASLIQA